MRDAVCQCGTQLDVLKTDSGCVTPAVDQRPRGLDARQEPAKASSFDRFVGDEALSYLARASSEPSLEMSNTLTWQPCAANQAAHPEPIWPNPTHATRRPSPSSISDFRFKAIGGVKREGRTPPPN